MIPSPDAYSVDIEQQKYEVFSFVAKNSMTLEITWEKIADTLEQFINMGNLAQNIRMKFNLQPSRAEGTDITIIMYVHKLTVCFLYV